MKDLQIFKDKSKIVFIAFFNFKKKPTFKNFFTINQKEYFFKSNNTIIDKPKLAKILKS